MTRIATIPLQRTLSGAIQRSQANLATSQLQLNSRKKVNDYAGLGIDAVRTLSARSMLAQQKSYQSVASRVSTTLSMYEAQLEDIDSNMANLQKELLTAAGTGDAPGLQHLVESTFQSVRNALNAKESGIPMFAGSQTDQVPFVPTSLAAVQALADPADAFLNDQVRHSGRVGDNIDIEYGVTASEVGTDLIPVFKALADAGPFGEKLTEAQKTAIKDIVSQIDTGLKSVRTANSQNGRAHAKVEQLQERAKDREILLTDVIGSVEDADLGQVAIDISQRKTILEASYSVFNQLSSLSLANYLR